MNFDEKFRRQIPSLTKSQKALFEYILAHEDESIFLNISKLAKRAQVSEATVVRLAKALGYKGFPDFQQELRQFFRNKLTTTSRLQKTAHKDSSEEDILAKVMHTDIENIQDTLRENSAKEFGAFIKSMDEADRIIIVGLRSVHSLAVFFSVALEFLQKKVWVVQPGIGNMWDQLLGLQKNDIMIGIAFPRYTQLTIDVIRFAKNRGMRVLVITDSFVSPLVPYADQVLTARCRLDSFIESFTAPLSLINAIVTALGVRQKDNAINTLKELEGIWNEQDIYHKR